MNVAVPALLMVCAALQDGKGDTSTASRYVALIGGDVYTVTKGTIRGATVLIKDGRIHRIGPGIAVPEGAQRFDVAGMRVLPGFVAVQASGLGEAGAGPSGKIADALDPFQEEIRMALASGITAAFLQPGGGRSTSRGRSNAVVKMSYGNLERMVLREPVTVSLAALIHSAPSRRYELRERLRKARGLLRKERDYEDRKSRGALKKGEKPPSHGGMEREMKLLKGELTGYASVRNAEQIGAMLSFVEEFGIRCVLADVVEAWILAEKIGRAHAYCVLTPRRRAHRDPDLNRPNGSRIEQAALLHRAGVKFAVVPLNPVFSVGGMAGRDLQTLPLEAAFAVRGGLSEEAALRSITIHPAEMLGVADRIGSIEVGKDADLIVLNGDPFDYRTFVEFTFVDGRLIYDRSKSTYFSHIRPRVVPRKGKAAAPDPVSGRWVGTMEIPAYRTKASFTADLKLDGTKVTGTVTTRMMNRTQSQAVEGSFTDGILRIRGKQQGGAYEIVMRPAGAGRLKGTWHLTFGRQKLTGPVECRKQ